MRRRHRSEELRKSPEQRGRTGEREFHTPFFFICFLKKIIFPDREQDARKIIREIEVTCWNLRERIRVRELASTHRLERMRCLRMLEEQKPWKREASFDRIEIIAEMHAQRVNAGFDSEPLHTGLYHPRWPHTPEEDKLDMDVRIERQRLEILLSQPAPLPQDKLSRRRSPAVGTGLDEHGMPRAETQQTVQEGIFPLPSQCQWVFVRQCTSPERETMISIQTDVGVDDEETTTYSTSRRLPGVCETADWPATARDGVDRAKQAV